MALRLLTLLLVTLTLSPCGAQPTTNITTEEGRVFLSDRGELNLALETDAEALLLAVHEMCYYYNTCYESLSVPDHVASLLTCCVPCDCSDDCFAVGNCCRDKIDALGRTEEARMITGNGETCMATQPEAYLMVGTCYPEYAGKAAAMCLNPDPASLHELTPVDSLDTNVTYRNVYCSHCNYETGIVFPWTTKVRCKRYVPVSNVESLESRFLEGGCNFTVDPNGFSKKCYKRTSTAECAGGEYEALCNTVPGGRTYVNELRDNLCRGCGLAVRDACLPRWVQVSFEVILNLGAVVGEERGPRGRRRDDDSASKLKEKECPEGETFLNEENTCLRVSCPPSQITETARNVHCIDPFFMVEGLCLDTRLSVTVATNGTATPQLEHLALEEAKKLFPMIWDNPLIPLVEPTVLDYRATSKQFVYTVHVVESISAYANVFSQYQLFRDRLDSLMPPAGVSVELGTAGLSFMPQPLEEVGYLAYADNRTVYDCLRMIAVSELQFCRSVLFSAEEYGIQGDDLVMNEGPMFQAHEYVLRVSRDGNSSHAQVCLETYLSRLESSASRSSGIWVFIVCIASLVSASV